MIGLFPLTMEINGRKAGTIRIKPIIGSKGISIRDTAVGCLDPVNLWAILTNATDAGKDPHMKK